LDGDGRVVRVAPGVLICINPRKLDPQTRIDELYKDAQLMLLKTKVRAKDYIFIASFNDLNLNKN